MAVGNLTPGPHTWAASTWLMHHLASLPFLPHWGLTSQHRLVSDPHYDSASQLLGWQVFLTAANHQTFLHLILDTVIMIRWAWSGVLLSVCHFQIPCPSTLAAACSFLPPPQGTHPFPWPALSTSSMWLCIQVSFTGTPSQSTYSLTE